MYGWVVSVWSAVARTCVLSRKNVYPEAQAPEKSPHSLAGNTFVLGVPGLEAAFAPDGVGIVSGADTSVASYGSNVTILAGSANDFPQFVDFTYHRESAF